MHAYDLRSSSEMKVENVKTAHDVQFSWKFGKSCQIRIFLKKDLGSLKIILAGSVKLTYIKQVFHFRFNNKKQLN